jgi:hypothetical protein
MNVYGIILVITILLLLITVLIYYFGKQIQSNKDHYFIGGISVKAYQDRELLSMIESGKVHRSFVLLSEQDVLEIERELGKRGYSL